MTKKQQGAKDNWRDVGSYFRIDTINAEADALEERWDAGSRLYGDEFQGEPVPHALEEVRDLFFYLHVAQAQIDELKARLASCKCQ